MRDKIERGRGRYLLSMYLAHDCYLMRLFEKFAENGIIYVDDLKDHKLTDLFARYAMSEGNRKRLQDYAEQGLLQFKPEDSD